ncbi:MAG: metallophosphoesterase [Telluria sp.]
MRIQLFSDLHLESDPGFSPKVAPDTDVVVLAGDIGSYQPGSRLDSDDFGLARFAPERLEVPRVLYIPGNHEFDSLEFGDAYTRLRETCERLGITWLEREVVAVGHVRFIGSTLWSDFDAIAGKEPDTDARERMRSKAFRAANWYLSRNTTFKDGAPVLAEDMRAMSLESQAWLRDALAEPFDGATVAVTHYAPSLRSADPRYGLTPGTAGFCNSLDELFPLVDVWMHGHLHCLNDYVVEGRDDARLWSCRVVANPLGYARKGEREAFREDLVITL